MGYKQDLENVASAARLAAPISPHIRFVFMGDGSDRRRLEALASDIPNIEFLDPQPKETFMSILAAADVLLVNERTTVLDMSLPSKITSYFCAGRPVVAAVPSGGATSAELVKSGGALVVQSGDPGALLDAIQSAIGDSELSRRLQVQAARYAEKNLNPARLLERADELVRDLMKQDQTA
jgi:glycosyltransferase involved in cell wall biosynthesis